MARQGVELGHRRGLASLIYVGRLAPAHPSTHFDDSEYTAFLKDTLNMEGLIAQHARLVLDLPAKSISVLQVQPQLQTPPRR